MSEQELVVPVVLDVVGDDCDDCFFVGTHGISLPKLVCHGTFAS